MGGQWGMLTHIMAVFLGIVDKPPILQGMAPAVAVIIAIFEFVIYWGIILIASSQVNQGRLVLRNKLVR